MNDLRPPQNDTSSRSSVDLSPSSEKDPLKTHDSRRPPDSIGSKILGYVRLIGGQISNFMSGNRKKVYPSSVPPNPDITAKVKHATGFSPYPNLAGMSAAVQTSVAGLLSKEMDPEKLVEKKALERLGSETHLVGPDFDEANQIAKGRLITCEFKDHNDNVVLREETSRAPTTNILLNSVLSKQKAIQKELEEYRRDHPNRGADDEQEKKYLKEIAVQQKNIDLCRMHVNQGAEWASPNTGRDACKNIGLSNYQKQYMPVLTNLRSQAVVDPNEPNAAPVSRVNRSGAVTDFSTPHVSLRELKDFTLLVALLNQKPPTVTPANHDMLELYGILDEKGAVDSTKLRAMIEGIKNGIKVSYGERYPKLFNAEGNINEVELGRVITERTGRLKQQVLQDLYVHFQNKPVEAAEVVYGRTGLVDMDKSVRHGEAGFEYLEKTQALDMHAIYEEFDNKTVKFDVPAGPDAGPYIDRDGIIHMPANMINKEKMGDKNETTLQTLFFNVSVQGSNTANTGMQKVINHKAMEKLGRLNPPDSEYRHLLARFEPTGLEEWEKHPFGVADETINIIEKMGYASTNCYGGKDRTGYVCAKQTVRKLSERTADPSLISKWSLQTMSAGGTAIQVVEDCADHHVLKIEALTPGLYQMNTWQGVAMRVNGFIDFGILWTSEKTAKLLHKQRGKIHIDRLYNDPPRSTLLMKKPAEKSSN